MNRRYFYYIFLGCCLIALTACIAMFTVLTPQKAQSLTNQIDEYLISQDFHGSVLVAKDGKVLISRGYGLANIEHSIANTPKTVFRIGSITKQFTAVAILQLQENGLLNIDEPIIKYFPDYPEGDKITIHHLLSHTSGIPSICDFANLHEIQVHPSTPNTVIDHFKNLLLHFAPGTDCEYSDSGYILLGAIIETVTNKSYERYLQENIFDPLGMHATYYEHNKSVIPNRASGYATKDGVYNHAGYIDMSFPHAAGALSSTVEDFYKWNRALQGLSKSTLISEDSREALFTAHASSEGRNCTYGYGFRVGPKNKGMDGCHSSIVGHYGAIEGFEAASVQYRDEDLIIILFSNVEKSNVRGFHKEIANLVHSFHSSWRSSATL